MLEYQCVKDEQKIRINTRDNLLYATLTAMAVVVLATLQGRHAAPLLLLLPPVTIILGWTYLVNDQKISAIGRYVRESLTPELTRAADTATPIFGWETAHRADSYRASRKFIQLVVDLTTFCLIPICAIIVYWIDGPHRAILIVISGWEVLALSVLAGQFFRYAEW